MAAYCSKEGLRHLVEKRMTALGVREKDIREKFIRSSGPGGQNVNKTATQVYLKHIPTGIEVKCQKERSQSANRSIARKMLLDKIESFSRKEQEEKRRAFRRLRNRTARKRPKAVRERILEEKKRRSQKKRLRERVRFLD